jgi:hypothetical protein
VLEGLPSLFDYLVAGVARQPRRGSLTVVLYHLLGDVVNAAEHALTHYFPLTLAEPFLQESSFGTPYQKWAKFTNDDFRKLDQCVRRLVPVAWSWYEEAVDRPARDRERHPSTKDAWAWFSTVKTRYAACVIDPAEPAATLSALDIRACVESAGGRFLNLWTRPPDDGREPPPPAVTQTTRDISDRAVIAELQRAGLTRLEEMRRLNAQFAGWLRAHGTMKEITGPHCGTLADCWLG